MKALIRILRNGVTHALSLVTSAAAGNVFRQFFIAGLLALAIPALTSCKKKPLPAPQGDESAATQPKPAKTNPELPARPVKNAITPAQSAFWDYIEAFHRLPDHPTDLQRRIFATRGVAPSFQFITTSPKSVFADVAGMKAHRERFAQRYPWVKRLLESEHITLEVDADVFRGNVREIFDKHFKKISGGSGSYLRPEPDRREFTKRWLESLLVIDFIFACGSAQDRIDGLILLSQTFSQAADSGLDSAVRKARGAELEIPAAFDIAMAIANEFPDRAPENLLNFLPLLLSSTGDPAAFIECLKWALRVQPFSRWHNLMQLNNIQVGNHCVRNGLLHYTIYWYHLHVNVRPDAGSSATAIEALFEKIYGKQEGQKEHKKYLALLDAAYPSLAKPTAPKAPQRKPSAPKGTETKAPVSAATAAKISAPTTLPASPTTAPEKQN